MRKIWIALSLMAFSCAAWAEDEESMVIDSGSADYDGKQITLSGDVLVNHEIGNISAGCMVLIPDNDQKKVRFLYLKMRDNVKISLKDGGQLVCSYADLDYSALKGKFNGGAQQEYVVYSESCGKGESRIPLVVKSKEMTVLLDRSLIAPSNSFRSSITEIIAENSVTVNYNHDFIVTSDHATYRRLPVESADSSASSMAGLISMTASDQSGLCQVTNRNGDHIHARQIQIDTVKRNLHFAAPKGAIYLGKEGDKGEKVDFSSDNMTWDDNRDLLTLRDNVLVNQKGIGQLKTNKEVQVYHYQAGGKKRIRSIESSGETVLIHSDEEKKLSHELTAYGKVIVDHEHAKTIIESPRDAKGKVLDGKQVYFRDYMGEIYADKVVLDYQKVEQSLNPTKLTLEGNVYILNRSSVNPEQSEAFLQYAIADVVEFYPKSNEMIMTAKNKGRVLFFDKVNNLQVSAPGVKITRDPAMKKESIQGMGDVRFSFVDKELEKLKEHFSIDALKGKE